MEAKREAKKVVDILNNKKTKTVTGIVTVQKRNEKGVLIDSSHEYYLLENFPCNLSVSTKKIADTIGCLPDEIVKHTRWS